MKLLFRKILIFVALAYGTIGLGYTIYTQFKYANQNVMGNSLPYRIAALWKGLFWPYYISKPEIDPHPQAHPTAETETNGSMVHFKKSIEWQKAAALYLINNEKVAASSNLSDYNEYMRLLKLAQDEALLVDTIDMKKEDPAFAANYIENYLKGLELQQKGYITNDMQVFQEGGLCLAKFLEESEL